MSQLRSTCLLEPCEENFFKGISRFFCLFRTLGVFFCFSTNFFTRGCQNCVVRVGKEFLRKIRLSERNLFYHHFRTFVGKFSALRQKFLNNVVKNAFYVPIGTLRGEKVFWKKNKNFFVVFGHAMKFFWSLIKTFPRRIVKTACYLSMETFWVERTSNAKNDFSDQFPKLSKKVGAYRRFFSKDCQKDVLHFQGMNLTKTSNFE